MSPEAVGSARYEFWRREMAVPCIAVETVISSLSCPAPASVPSVFGDT